MSEGIPLWITNSANLINSSVFTLACSSSGQSRQLPWWLSVSPWLCCEPHVFSSPHLHRWGFTMSGEWLPSYDYDFCLRPLCTPKKGIFPSVVQLCVSSQSLRGAGKWMGFLKRKKWQKGKAAASRMWRENEFQGRKEAWEWQKTLNSFLLQKDLKALRWLYHYFEIKMTQCKIVVTPTFKLKNTIRIM